MSTVTTINDWRSRMAGLRKHALVLLVALASIAAVTTTTAEPADAIYTNWTWSNAWSYGKSGIGERYTQSNTYQLWIDNNSWDSNEGADCSGFVSKSWAVPAYTWPNQHWPYGSGTRYTTYHYYTYSSYPSGQSPPDWKSTTWSNLKSLDVWVYRNSSIGNHMGFGIVKDTYGYLETWEARGTNYGIVDMKRKFTFFSNAGSRYRQRGMWK